MQKRLVSLLLVACILLTAIPVLALSVLAAEGEVNPGTSTNFSFDVNNPNFPTLNLPEATEASTHVALGKYDFSALKIGVHFEAGAVTYHGNWTVGSLGLTCDMATGDITYGNAYNAFTYLNRATEHDLAITDTTGTWTSGNSPSGGALFLNAALISTLSAPINYTKVIADDNADPRNASSYYSTTSVRYTAEYTGTISIDAAFAFAWDNGVDLVVLHNGEVVATVENDPEKAVGLSVTTSFDFGTLVSGLAVTQGDTIDFVAAGDIKYDYANVGEAFNYNHTKRGLRNFSFTVNYEEGWTYIDYEALYKMSTWDQGNIDLMDITHRTSLTSIHKFYTWFHADETPMKANDSSDPLTDDCYAVINPALFDAGILTDDMSWEQMWDAYGEYLKTCAVITYPGEWSAGNLVNGEYQLVEARVFTYGYSVYGCSIYDKKVDGVVVDSWPIATKNWESQFAATREVANLYIADHIAKGKLALQPTDGKLLFSEVADIYNTDEAKTMSYKWGGGHGGFNYRSGTYAIRPLNNTEPTAITYTVPDSIYGTAHIDLGSYLNFCGTTEKDGSFCVTLNGVAIWPADAVAEAPGTWYAIQETTDPVALTEALAACTFDISAGDEIQLRFTRGTTGNKKITLDIKPTVVIEKKLVVEFKDQYGDLLGSTVVKPGAAMPAAPVNSVGGYYINGATEAVATLPKTVEEHTYITYAGDLVIQDIVVEKASISVDDDFAVNLYLRGDPLATKVGFGVFLDGYSIPDAWGVKQADGTFKVTVSGLAAKDLNKEMDIYLYQQFEGGYEGYNLENYSVKATDILTTYTTDAAYADVKDLAAAALDYAAAAEAYFYGGELDADVAGRLATYDAAIAGLSKVVEVDGDFYDYAISAATVVLKDKAAIKIRINYATFDFLNDEISTLVAKVTDESGADLEYTGFKYQVGAEYDGLPLNAVLVLNPINAADYDKVWQITLYDDAYEQMSGTLLYSVNTYIARTFEGGAGETDNLLRAMYAFGAAADAYQA